MVFKILNQDYFTKMVDLAQQLNPNLERTLIENRQMEMFNYNNYTPFGCFFDGALVGITSGWMTTRIYSGKQLELDNVVMDATLRSQGMGNQFIEWIENWSRENGCQTVELNSYVNSPRAHKFYFKRNYIVAGFHFIKKLN